MAASSEITAMRAAGYSIRSIVITTLKLGFVLALTAFALGEWVAPKSEAYAQNFKVRMLQKQVAISSEGTWLKNGNQYLAIDKIWSEKKIDGISIYEVAPEQGGFSRIIKAESAHNEGEGWWLNNVTERIMSTDKVTVKNHLKLDAAELLPENMLELAQVNPEQLTALELARFIEHQSENQLSTERFELEYWKHFTTPLSTLVMLILAAPLVFGFQRNAGAGQRIFIGILIGIAYLLLDQIISRTGLVYGLSPLLSAALPLLLFSLAGLFMLNRGVRQVSFIDVAPKRTDPNEHTTACKQQLEEYFTGTRQTFDLVLDAQGTDFQQQVWQQLQTIPFGSSCSYQDIADALHNPKAVRAVGAANGKNPVAIIVPCHRGRKAIFIATVCLIMLLKISINHKQDLRNLVSLN
ncbi:unnamed protein product [Cyprideis torosa]|uniref:Uncharacterized protein n=1 Tax=Cyprideis torosa TaxID=163714 RepID=A0A7R8ZRD2_9CRUS|nr:unnamed protein product [Cyprideis torosa]CAG0903429.1 unnamed protein product [Cyprideis torosa]